MRRRLTVDAADRELIEVARLVLFVPADENDETLAGRDDVALLKAGIAHCPVGGFLFLLIRGGIKACVRAFATNSSERGALFHASLPLFTRES